MDELRCINPLLHSRKNWVKLGITSSLKVFYNLFVKPPRPEVFNVSRFLTINSKL